MTKKTITFDSQFSIRRAGGHVTVAVDKLPTTILKHLAYHGLTQKVGDAAAGVKKALDFMVDGKAMADADLTSEQLQAVNDKASALMQAVVDGLYEGEWTTRSDGEPVINRFIRQVLRPLMGSDTMAEYKALKEQSAKDAFLMAKWEAMDEATQEALMPDINEAMAEAKRRAEEDAKRKAKAAQKAKGLKLNI